jgi:predicted XRE-type DNA-binding protein
VRPVFIHFAGRRALDEIEGGPAVKPEKLELVRGSGNVFYDLRRENADIDQLKALLAAEIIKVLDRDEMTVRAAHTRTGFAAADFSRIRNADLARFTTDRLVKILNRLGSHVDVKIQVRRAEGVRGEATA